jgi:glycosyltransferase involved in cell wall biosynthesis
MSQTNDREPMPPANRRLRILLIAELCNPAWTSVPLVGYSMARALAARPDLDVTLVTQIRNEPDLRNDPIRRLAPVHFIDNEWVARPLHLLGRLLRGGETLAWSLATAMSWPSYIAFEHQVYRRFQNQLRSGGFDLIHRVTPLTPTCGSPLAKFTDVPMLIGPINGGLPWPREFPELRKREREWLAPLRKLYRALPYWHSTFRRLAGVIAGSKQTATEIPRWFRGKRFYLPENGIAPERFPLAGQWLKPAGRFRFISVGRLVPLKGFDLVLDAMSRSPILRQCELVIAGDGPLMAELRELSARLGLSDAVRLPGFIDNRQLHETFLQAQAFVFPSLREFGGGVVLEALASGLPAVVVNYGGPAELVTPECGERLRLQPREGLVNDLRRAMEGLAVDPERCRKLGAAAVDHVRRHFTWDQKAARLMGMYRELLGSAKSK